MGHTHVAERRQAYAAAGLSAERFAMRGVGALAAHFGAVLVATLPGGGGAAVEAGPNEVVITNVARERGTLSGTDCSLLTIWVRVDGPEIFAGKGTAVPAEEGAPCSWSFQFELAVPGDYRVDAKVLLYNGDVDYDGRARCAERVHDGNGTVVLLDYPQRAGFKGFKMYNSVLACCEICTRVRGCQQWATPPLLLPHPGFTNNGCDLFFGTDTDPSQVPVSHLIPHATVTLADSSVRSKSDLQERNGTKRRLGPVARKHGAPYNQATMQFLGCGWSYHYTLDFPCLSGDLDDRIPTDRRTFSLLPLPAAVEEKPSSTSVGGSVVDPSLPMCTLAHEALGHHRGRWVRAAYPGSETCPEPRTADPEFSQKFAITKFDPLRPSCWHRDDLSVLGNKCLEMNCKFIAPTSKWFSDLHWEKEFYATWQPYDCRYIEFTSQQLGRCLRERKISSIQTDGASIAEFLRQYLFQRLQSVTLYNASNPDARSVTLSTLALLHKAEMSRSELESELHRRANATERNLWYFTSAYFLSSERDVLTQVERLNQLQQLAVRVLEPKGYKLLNAFDLSAAFTYDTATQHDGMHIVGPPMKMIITKFFHHLCTEDGAVDPLVRWR